MSILNMKRFLIVCFYCLIGLSVKAQEIGSFLPAEKAVIELMARDTSSALVAVMPMKYRFGIRDLPFDRISILKLGGRILLLPDGQDAVFQWRPDLGKLVRIDSSRFSGSNFGMMPFVRRGELWQFGGYGFWKSRDMFSRFDEDSGQWGFEYSDSSVTGHLTLYFYDAVSDAFYMCGSYRNRPHDMHRTEFIDEMYRFDFSQRKWSKLGKLVWVSNVVELSNALHLGNTTVFASGMIHLMGSQTTMFDFRQNLRLRIRVGSDTALLRIGTQSAQYDRAWEQSIMMGDSLVNIQANEKEARVSRIFLNPSMFESMGPVWIDVAEFDAFPSDKSKYVWAFSAVLIIAGGLTLQRRRQNVMRSFFRYPKAQVHSESQTHDAADWVIFWKGLRSGHQVLLRYLVLEGDPVKGVDAEKVNHILGISRRPASLQKVHRYRAIQSINQVYQQTYRTKTPLIDRIKEPSDRRQTRFCISKDHHRMILNHIQS
jgi:hypothetical protein